MSIMVPTAVGPHALAPLFPPASRGSASPSLSTGYFAQFKVRNWVNASERSVHLLQKECSPDEPDYAEHRSDTARGYG